MTLSELTFCQWDGDPSERFRYADMNRIEYNANLLAREAGVSQVTFIEADRSQQFRYDEAQKLESLTYAIASSLGLTIGIRSWSYGGKLDWMDFERIEANLYACYQALGGIGQRIPAGKFRPIVSATLFADAWYGNPPYIDLEVPMMHGDAEALAYVPHTATVEQRVAEMGARLVASMYSDRVMRITATGNKPKITIPIKIALRGLPMIETKTLSTSWAGNGPWTQTITLENDAETAVVGMPAGMTSEQSRAFMRAGIHVSAISGSTLTIRALNEMPTIQIPISVLYSESEVV